MSEIQKKSACHHFRVKFIVDEELTDAFDFEPGHCWCLATMGEVGPDDDVVEVQLCQPGRKCYKQEED